MKNLPTKIIAVANQKGGVGKTTTAVNLAAYLAASEIPTLLVDMDPQGNASAGFGVSCKKEDTTVYDFLIGSAEFDQAMQKTQMEFLDLLPSNRELTGAEIELVTMISRERLLKNALESVRGRYRYIIIDSPPSLGILTINIFSASDSVLIPIQCEYYALEGLSALLNTIRLVQKHLNKNLEIEGVLITMYDRRLNLSRMVVDEVENFFGDKMYKTFIHRNVRLGEAPSHGVPIVLYDGYSVGARNYMDLVSEILSQNEEE